MKYYELKKNDVFMYEGERFCVIKSDQYNCPSRTAMCKRGLDCVCDDLWFISAYPINDKKNMKHFKLNMWDEVLTGQNE